MIVRVPSRLPGVVFEWDSAKAESNFRKHRISFDEARTVFEDPDLILLRDDAHSADEDRFIALGFSIEHSVLFVVHTYRVNSDLIRIISARQATRAEEKTYEAEN